MKSQKTAPRNTLHAFAQVLRARVELLRGGDFHRSRKGMTLVEIMIVVTIMASIMAVAGVYVFDYLEESDMKITQQEVDQLASGAETCYSTRKPRSYPSTIEELVKCGHIRNVDVDAWGNEYRLEASGNRGGEIISAGPDGSYNSEDDLKAAYGKMNK